MKTTVYCMVENGGDGSVWIRFFDKIEVAKWIEEQDLEAFSESTVAQFVINHDGPIKIEVETVLSTYIKLFEGHATDKQLDEYYHKFFPDGLPEFDLEQEPLNNGYQYVHFMIENKCAGMLFVSAETEMDDLMKRLKRECE